MLYIFTFILALPKAWTFDQRAMNFTILIEDFMDVTKMQAVFFLTCVREDKKIFENLAFLAYFAPPLAPRGL